MNATITYRGPTRTTHPALGELVPDEPREIPERDVPAALQALLAGLSLEIVLPDDVLVVHGTGEEATLQDPAGWIPPVTLHASAQGEEE